MSLNDTPGSSRIHIGLFGCRNVGKSSLMNAVTGQDLAVVSAVKGTTTDPVRKAMELLPLGPVVITDTPGFDDEGELGELRVKKTRQKLATTDIAILVTDATRGMNDDEKELLSIIQAKEIPCVIAYNKDLFDEAGASVPTTYQEFLDTCQKLTDAGIAALCIPCGEAWYGGQFLQQLCNLVGGTELYDFTVSDEVEWNDERFVQAGTMLKDIMDKGYLINGFLGMDSSEGFERFNNKDVAMMMMITSGVNTVVSGSVAPDQVDFFLLPSDDAENTGVNVGSIGQTYAISSQAENKEAAAAFLKQLSTSTEFQQTYTDNGQVTVTGLEMNLENIDPMILRSRILFEQMKLYTPWLDRIYGAGEGVEFNNASVAILGGTDPQEAMDDLQQFAIDNAEN